jgi:FKBP-type peptidyl-prolyl cis-trans isomerase FklB
MLKDRTMSRWTYTAWMLPLLCGSLALAQGTPPAGAAAPLKPLTTLNQQASYAIGLDFGQRLARDGAPIDLDAINRGFRDGLTGGKPELSDEQIQAAMEKFISALQAKRDEQAKGLADKNKKEGAAFLAANAKKPGVKQTASGLQYKVLKSGTGATPKKTDAVRVHYHGTFLDGSVFDSSVERKTPAEFGVGDVIAGWTEALQLMKVGDKWQLFIPSDLAYGDQGRASIPPATLLVFEVELLDIVK